MKKLFNIFYYLQGWLRYHLYYSRYFSWLIPLHIHQQIDARINSMDKECYMSGSCKLCGCATTALQMANKACDKPCYPAMIKKEKWNRIIGTKSGYAYFFTPNSNVEDKTAWAYHTETKVFKDITYGKVEK